MASSIRGGYIRSPKKTPAWAWIVYVCLALLIIGFIFYQLFEVLEKNLERNRAFTAYYRSLKCSSLCPVESILDEHQKQQRLFDASCQSMCEKNYLELLSEHERSLLDGEQFQEDPTYVTFLNITQTYAQCYSQMKSNISFYHTVCFQDLFFRVQKEADISQVRIPSYISYAFSILDVDCGTLPSVKILHLRGYSQNLSLRIIAEDRRGARLTHQSSSVPTTGESQVYPLMRPRSRSPSEINLSQVGVFSVDSSDGKILTNTVWKTCPR